MYVVVPMSFYCIFPIAIALDHSESSQQQFQVARVLVALLNLVDHGKPRQLRDNDRFQCWSWSLSLSSIGTQSRRRRRVLFSH